MNKDRLFERMQEKFAEKYEFRLAKRSDIGAIMQYIDEAWKKNHILAVNRELFEYEFCEGDDVHFLLAIDKETGCIEGMDGFYYTSSIREKKKFDVWGSMWSVRKDHKNLPMLGIEIANQYYEQVGFRYELGIGVNKTTATPLQQNIFEVVTGTMNHFYMLNDLPEYRIAKINNKNGRIGTIKKTPDKMNLKLAVNIKEVEAAFDFISKVKTYPYKDGWYIKHRFFEHPYYKYQVYLLMKNGKEADAVLVMKKVEHKGHYVLRIVDYLGDVHALFEVSSQLSSLMHENCEYMDFYNIGYSEDSIVEAGFVKRTKEDANIIPSYFEPFEQRNVDYWFNSDAPDNFVICKADADQDRPNVMI